MTANTVTYLGAREHINDLLRDADRDRRADQVTAPRHLRRWLAHPVVRRVPTPATA